MASDRAVAFAVWRVLRYAPSTPLEEVAEEIETSVERVRHICEKHNWPKEWWEYA